MRFTKMHGIGNDFVMVDAVEKPFAPSPEFAARVCDRRRGVGSDGLIVLERGSHAPFRMRMFNPDGSESEMCGNGVRCAALFLRDRGHLHDSAVKIETGAGILELSILEDGCVQVDMGPARLTRGEIGITGDPTDTFVRQPLDVSGVALEGTAVSMGNPHLVIPVADVSAVPLEEWGPALERHELFPNRVNVHFVQVLSGGALLQRTWERGAGATLACGTGACAATVACHNLGLTDRRVTVSLPGGELLITYLDNGRVLMAGPAESVFEGDWLLDLR
jgi:diaminopimelate epimerase